MAYCPIDQGSLYYEVTGKGSPLVLIAGLGSDVQSWITVKKQLALHYRLILIDNRGVGRTEYPQGSVSTHQMAEDVVHLLDHLKIKSAYVLGHSMGGMVAMNLATSYPHLVKRLILAATTTKVNQRNIQQFRDWATLLKLDTDRELWYKNLFYWLFSDHFFEQPAMLTAYLVGALSYRYPLIPSAFCEQVEAAIAFDLSEGVNQINCPTLVIHAEHDRLFTSYESRYQPHKNSNFQSKVIPDAGHSLHSEQPESFIQAIKSFLG